MPFNVAVRQMDRAYGMVKRDAQAYEDPALVTWTLGYVGALIRVAKEAYGVLVEGGKSVSPSRSANNLAETVLQEAFKMWRAIEDIEDLAEDDALALVPDQVSLSEAEIHVKSHLTAIGEAAEDRATIAHMAMFGRWALVWASLVLAGQE